MEYLLPLAKLLSSLDKNYGFKTNSLQGSLVVIGAAVGLVLAVLVALRLLLPKYLPFVFKSLRRNFLRTALAGMAVMVLVFVVTLVWSFLVPLEVVMAEKAKDFKAIISERLQVPSQMPRAYQNSLEEGGYTDPTDVRVKPEDSMTWSFYGGTIDPTKRTFENVIFFFVMDPRKLPTMMDELENLDPALIEKLATKKDACILGEDRLKKLNKRVGERFKVTSFNYKDIDLEFEIVGTFPKNPRYDQSAVMHRDYLYDALDKYERDNKRKHPMAEKPLNLVWLRVPDSETFSKVGNQIMSSPRYTAPYVKVETNASGIASFLEPYRDILWGVKWLLVPSLLVIMALVMAMAISINVRERRTEMAVLKVLGYTPGRVQAIVLGEALLIGICSGLLSAVLSYGLVHGLFGGIPFQIAFFPVFDIFPDALWWGPLFGAFTTLAGSILPAWSARTVKVSEVFAKVA